MAQAGGGNLEAIPDALARVREILDQRLAGRGVGPAGADRGRVVALDLGEVRTGVAVSDPERVIASPLQVVPSGDLSSLPAPARRRAGRARGRRRGTQDARGRGRLPGAQNFGYTRRLETGVSRRAIRGVGRAAHDPHRRRRSRSRTGSGKKKPVRVDHLAAARMLQEYLEARKERVRRYDKRKRRDREELDARLDALGRPDTTQDPSQAPLERGSDRARYPARRGRSRGHLPHLFGRGRGRRRAGPGRAGQGGGGKGRHPLRRRRQARSGRGHKERLRLQAAGALRGLRDGDTDRTLHLRAGPGHRCDLPEARRRQGRAYDRGHDPRGPDARRDRTDRREGQRGSRRTSSSRPRARRTTITHSWNTPGSGPRKVTCIPPSTISRRASPRSRSSTGCSGSISSRPRTSMSPGPEIVSA